MNTFAIWAIFKRDFKSYFGSLLGYLFVAVFLLLTFAAAFRPWGGDFFNANAANLALLTEWFPLLVVIFVPAVTMGSWASERQRGTDSFLFTLPANDWELVLAKFAGCFGIYSVALLCTLVSYVATLEIFGDPDWGLLFGNYVGYWLLGGFAISVGMLGSAVPKHLTLSWILGAVFCALTTAPDWVGWIGTAPWTDLVAELGVLHRFETFGEGVLALPDILYFCGLTATALYANAYLLGRRHWTNRWGKFLHGFLRLASVGVAVVSLTLLATSVTLRLDVTSERMLSLTSEAKSVLSNLDEKRPVLVQAWISKTVPESYQATREGLVNMLREFDARGGKKLHVAIYETEPYTPGAQRAETSFGIKPQKVRDDVGGRQTVEDIFLGLALTCGSRELTIPFFDKGLPIQYELTRAVGAVSQQKKREVSVLPSAVNVFGGFDFKTMNSSEEWQVLADLRKQYDIQRADGVAAVGSHVLVAPLPSSLPQDKMDFVAEHLFKGGRALLLCDPYPAFDPNLAPTRPSDPPRNPFQQQRGAPKPPKGQIEALLGAMGLTWHKDRVTWDAYNPHPEWGQIPRELVFVAPDPDGDGPMRSGFNEADPVTSGLQELVLIYPGELGWDEASEDVEVTPLLWTGEAAGYHGWREMIRDGMFGIQEIPESERTYEVYYDVAITDAGNALDQVKTAAARLPGRHGLVKDPDLATLPVLVARGLTRAKAEGCRETLEKLGAKVEVRGSRRVLAVRVKGRMRATKDGDGYKQGDLAKEPFEAIVIADMDLVSNMFYSLRSRGEADLSLDNVTFVANCIDSLAGEDRYIALRKLRPKHRTLTRIEEVLKKHEEAYREAVQEAGQDADAKLKEAKDRLQAEVTTIEQRTDLDPRTKRIMIQSAQQAESIKYEREEKRIGEKKQRTIRFSKIKRDLAVKIEQRAFLAWALLFCLTPILALGFAVLFIKFLAERAGVDPARRR